MILETINGLGTLVGYIQMRITLTIQIETSSTHEGNRNRETCASALSSQDLVLTGYQSQLKFLKEILRARAREGESELKRYVLESTVESHQSVSTLQRDDRQHQHALIIQ